jgi:acetylxylan esterase
VLIFADVRHTANQTYNVESGSGLDGTSARPESQLVFINKFAEAKNLRSYCVETDPICALGSDGVTHTTYFENFSEDATEWVHQQLEGDGPTYPATPVAPTSTSTTRTSKPTSTSTHSKTRTSSTASPTTKPNSANPLQFSDSLIGLAVVAALAM